MGKLGRREDLRVCYEAGPTGHLLYWQLSELGVHCDVVAPTLVPVKAGDRVKTDRRDAEKLARCYRAGDLTPVWVPDAAHGALRNLVRARLAAKRDQLRARHRLGKFLLRQGRRAPEGTAAWTGKYLAWVKQQRFEHAAQRATLLDYLHEVEHIAERIVRLGRSIGLAVQSMPTTQQGVIAELQCLRELAKASAVTLVSEMGQLARFASARQLMGYAGMVARALQRSERAAWFDQQGGQRAPAPHRDRSGVELPSPPGSRRRAEGPAGRGPARRSKQSPGGRSTGCMGATGR